MFYSLTLDVAFVSEHIAYRIWPSSLSLLGNRGRSIEVLRAQTNHSGIAALMRCPGNRCDVKLLGLCFLSCQCIRSSYLIFKLQALRLLLSILLRPRELCQQSYPISSAAWSNGSPRKEELGKVYSRVAWEQRLSVPLEPCATRLCAICSCGTCSCGTCL